MLKMILLLAAYAIAPVVAGHGVMPMAYLLFLPTWQMALVWAAIVLAVAAFVILRAGSLVQLVSHLASAIILYSGWLANILYINQFNSPAEQRGALESMLLFSVPFQLATFVVVGLLVVQIRRIRSRPHDA